MLHIFIKIIKLLKPVSPYSFSVTHGARKYFDTIRFWFPAGKNCLSRLGFSGVFSFPPLNFKDKFLKLAVADL